jgi:Bacterial Ig domain
MRQHVFAPLAAAALICSTPPAGAFLRPGPSNPTSFNSFTPTWQDLSLGDGGQKTSFSYYSDGTFLARNDTYGGHLRRAAGSCTQKGKTWAAPCWQQLFMISSIPSSEAVTDTSNGGNLGTVELVSCPSNTNVGYALWNGALHITTNLKASPLAWAKTTLTSGQNANSGPKNHGPFIACDPNNPDIAYIATDANLQKTANGTSGGSANFTTVTGVGSTGAVPDLIVYDPNTPVTGGVSQHFFVFVAGAGLYETSNGGGSFNLRSGGGPTGALHVIVDKFSQVWLVAHDGNIYRYASSTWTTFSPTGAQNIAAIASDPNSTAIGSNHVVAVQDDGSLLATTNNGTFNGPNYNTTFSATGAQPGWLGVANQQSAGVPSSNIMNIVFDTSSNLWSAGGISPWVTPAPVAVSGTVQAADAVGIEQLVTNQIYAAPGCSPAVGVWDRGMFLVRNPDVFPSVQFPNSTLINQIQGAWGFDYAAGSVGFLTAAINSNISSDISPATTTDCGNTWTAWPSAPSGFGNGSVIAASTTTNWLLEPNQNAALVYTLNGGTSWSPTSVPGSPTFDQNYVDNRQPLAADRFTAGTFYAIDTNQNCYKSTDQGATLTLQSSGPIGGFVFSDMLLSVPGNGGNLFYVLGPQNSPHPDTNAKLWKSTNGCQSWQAVGGTALREPLALGFGAPQPGGSGYPAIYTEAWLNGVKCICASYDGGTTWAALNIPTGILAWALDSVDLVTTVSGDMNVYGRVYVGFRGSGASYIDAQDACPWVNFSSVKPGDSLTGTITLQATASGRVPVSTVNFYVDGTLIGTQTTGSGTPTVYSQNWNASGVTAGSHTLKVLATGNNAACTTGLSQGNSFSIPVTTH